MKMALHRILIDTSVWIPFFNLPRSIEKTIPDRLIDRGDVVMTGVVLSELLQGVSGAKERNQIHAAFLPFPFLEATFHTWALAGELGLKLRSRGRKTPLSDLVLAAVAIENNAVLFTKDKHFDNIPGLKLFNERI